MKRARVLLFSCVLTTTVATAPAQTFTNLHSFAGPPGDGAGDGAGPNGTLLLVGSTLYGTTFDGGNANNGVIFKLNTNGTGYSITKHFPASSLNTIGVSTNAGGANPLGGLTLSGGTVYGVGSQAGRFGSGTLFSFNTSGGGFNAFKDFSPLQSSDNTNDDGATPNAGLLVVGDTCYGTTGSGGNFGNGTVFKVNTNGTGYTVLRHFAAIPPGQVTIAVTNGDGINPQAALVLGGDTLYGTASRGGSGGRGAIFKLSTNGTGFTVIKNFSPVSNTTNSDGATPGPNLVLSGNTLYGTADVGGMSGNGTAFKVNTDGSGFTVLRSFSLKVSGSSTNVDGAFPSWGLVLSGDTLYGTTQNGGAEGVGTLFGIKTNGTGFVAMHNFSTEEGNPGGNLILSGDTFYGTTENSSLNGFGIIFSFQLPSSSSPSTGALQVALGPLGAVTAGAHWQVDGGAPQNSGTTLTGIPYGNHLLTFTAAPGWITPADRVVVIKAGATTISSNNYAPAPATGALKVTIIPSGAVSLGAKWQLDGGAPQNSGAVVSDLPLGDYTVSFTTIDNGYVTPADQIVTITANTTNPVSGDYSPLVQFNSAVQVIMNPPAAVTAGAHWKLDGGSVPLYNSGDVVGGLPAGNHTVAFTTVAGWATPADTNVNVSADTTNTVTGTYTQADAVKPKIVITAPTPNLVWNSSAFIASGTATDNVAVASVYLQLNNDAWTNATTANGWTNWTADVTLTPGTNTIRAYAVDSSGNTSVTNSVNVIYALANVLGVQIVGKGTLTPNLNGQSLQIGVRYTMTAKAASGFVFSGWSGSLATNKTVLSFIMQSNYAFTATFTDAVKPTLAVTSPKSGQKWSNAVFTVTGTAKDNGPLANVFYQLNGSSWSNAATANGWSNWNASVTLTPGLNNLRTCAMDAQGNRSATNSLSFTYILSAPLIVQTNGRGTISPNYNNALLQVNGKYVMTAKPAKGFGLSKWTDGAGSTVTNTPKLSFTMVSNLVFVANFVDITRPVNVITVPAVNQKWSNAVFNASGKATDNVGVSNVSYQLNGAGWNQAIFALNHTNWSTTNLTLLSGSNMIQAFAADAAGNVSLTNSVKFTYTVLPVADWAPDSLNGLLAQAAPSNGSPTSLGFDINTFAQSGTNSGDFGVGTYTYNKSSTNTGSLTLSFASPPGETNDDGTVDLVFTNHYAGYFTNTDSGDFGGINLVVATNRVPGSLAGKTVTAIESDNSQTNAIKLVNGVGFTRTGGGGSSSGTYTLTRFSPVCTVLTLTFTNVADVGKVVYVQTVFTNAAAGIYSDSSYNLGVFQDNGNGRFTVR